MKTIVTMVVRDRKEVDRLLAIRHDLTDLDCYEPVVDHFSKQCFRLSQVGLLTVNHKKLLGLLQQGCQSSAEKRKSAFLHQNIDS